MNAETKNIEVTDPVTIAVAETEFKEIQIEMFTAHLSDILDCDVLANVEFSETILVSVETKIVAVLSGSTLIKIAHFAESCNLDISIAPSAPGLKIQFTLKNN